jgi:hypothetical protein
MNVWTKILEKTNMKITRLTRKVATLKESQKSKFLTAALVKAQAFWDVTVFRCVKDSRRFERS